ncbi:TonB-dependent receptor [Flavobacteriaceae bacterium F08102]|nr:TonB-dependent receptor [Flavobacteriaceae bacterium F08102]
MNLYFFIKSLCTLVFSTVFALSFAQTMVNGTVKTTLGTPVHGANVFIENTYDGATTNADGTFSFTSTSTGIVVLKISMIGFQTVRFEQDITTLKKLDVRLVEAIKALDPVILSAGSFHAGDASEVSVMDALDVVTTAGVAGDFIAALQTLPGTQTVGEDGRLFVRGGSADETQVFIDGLNVFKPYIPTSPNNPTRGRYSPFLFDGITFSTGGYSAEFGNALSSVLLLNTIDEPKDTETTISLMSLGLGLGHTEKWDKDALSVNMNYINLAPYNALIPDKTTWIKLPESMAGETVYRHKFTQGMFKFYSAFDYTRFSTDEDIVGEDQQQRFDLNNANWYSNTSYKGLIGAKSKISTGLSYSKSKLQINENEVNVEQQAQGIHAKVVLTHDVSKMLSLNYGAELMYTDFVEQIGLTTNEKFENSFKGQLSSAFVETDFEFTNRFAGKFGLRLDHHSMVDQPRFAPRVSLAYRINKGEQCSLAYGNFYQTPFNDLLKFHPDIEFQKADHYLLNYQWKQRKQLLRTEIYYKNYQNLLTYTTQNKGVLENIQNEGMGYAAGLDLFWKDSKSIDFLTYWLSYSYLDTKRKFQDYPTQVMPSFATKHNASIVTKYWIDAWRSQWGMTYNFTSGRPYNNPNSPNFMSGRTKHYHNLSLNWSYLISPQKILYFSVTNIFGFDQVFGYEYARKANANGVFIRKPIVPSAKRGFFVGFFWTLSTNKSLNQLDNL